MKIVKHLSFKVPAKVGDKHVDYYLDVESIQGIYECDGKITLQCIGFSVQTLVSYDRFVMLYSEWIASKEGATARKGWHQKIISEAMLSSARVVDIYKLKKEISRALKNPAAYSERELSLLKSNMQKVEHGIALKQERNEN